MPYILLKVENRKVPVFFNNYWLNDNLYKRLVKRFTNAYKSAMCIYISEKMLMLDQIVALTEHETSIFFCIIMAYHAGNLA